MAGIAHHGRAWIVVFINAVTKAHQTEGVIFVFGAFNKFRNMLNGADLFQHTQGRFVGTTVRRSPQGGDPGGDTGKRIRAA